MTRIANTSAAGAPMGPVFLVGALRSGTTLFRLMLRGHRDLGFCEEFEIGLSELGDAGFPYLVDYHRFLETSREAIFHGFDADRSLPYPALVRDFLRQARERSGKSQVCAVVHSRFDRCPEIWPEARYVHLIRDPRDVARSCIGMGWVGNAYHGADYWVEAEQRYERLARRTRGEQRYEVRYEQLVREPERVLGGVCEFLGVDYDPGMLDYAASTTYDDPDPSLLEQWRTKLTRRQVRRIEARCGALLVDRGYTPSGYRTLALSPMERAFLRAMHRVRRARSSIEKYGPGLWTEERIAKWFGSELDRRRLQHLKNSVDELHLK